MSQFDLLLIFDDAGGGEFSTESKSSGAIQKAVASDLKLTGFLFANVPILRYRN